MLMQTCMHAGSLRFFGALAPNEPGSFIVGEALPRSVVACTSFPLSAHASLYRPGIFPEITTF